MSTGDTMPPSAASTGRPAGDRRRVPWRLLTVAFGALAVLASWYVLTVAFELLGLFARRR